MKFDFKTMYNSTIQRLQELDLLQYILYTWGIPGMQPGDNRSIHAIHTVSVLVMFANHLYTFVLYSHYLGLCSKFQCSKVVISLIMWRLFAVANWYSVFVKRREVRELLASSRNLDKRYKAKIDKNKLIVNVLMVGILAVLFYLLIMILVILWNDPATASSRFDEMTFRARKNTSQDSSSSQSDQVETPFTSHHSFKVAATFLVTSTTLLVKALSVFLTVFYTTWCHSLSQVLAQCGDRLEHHSDRERAVLQFLVDYDAIHDMCLLTESALSMQVFWLSSSHFVMVFIQFSKILGFYTYSNSIFVENTVLAALQCVSFFAVTYFASEVHKQDKVLREIASDLGFRIRLSKGSRDFGDLLEQFLQSKEVVIFSALGIFDFTKGFLLSSTGVLISYNLLILQLDIPNVPY
ncbi:hypothetical protein JTE90_017655 [Oedothorax gibbosus]|uniref:Gustatory receptor n=1 Tax=Oedothorax gibbosus TaxID=931172 RepID=A0AAV6U190_9ARAC|nr:hypothetical protein JTE90_017655 [Oedothorax gibbosus]